MAHMLKDMYDISKIRVQVDVFNRNFAYSLNQGLHLYKSARLKFSSKFEN